MPLYTFYNSFIENPVFISLSIISLILLLVSIYFRLKVGSLPYHSIKMSSQPYIDSKQIKFLNGFNLWDINTIKETKNIYYFFLYIISIWCLTIISWIIFYFKLFPKGDTSVFATALEYYIYFNLVIFSLASILYLFSIPGLEAYLDWLEDQDN